MWTWDQSEGKLYYDTPDGSKRFVASGYSGKDWAKNNPKAQGVKGMGPIPRGLWLIKAPYLSANTGPYTLTLWRDGDQKLDDTDDTTGRGSFRIHGDSARNPGGASHGCIILPRPIRERIWDSGDHMLRVIE